MLHLDHKLNLRVRPEAEVAEAINVLRQFAEAGYDPFPLRVGAKTPAHKGWQSRDYGDWDFHHWLFIGGNIGLRLGPTDLIIDLDPRNVVRGDDPLGRLGEAAGCDLTDAPTTITGSGGLHLFYRRPEGLRLVGRLADFPGIDFKSNGLVVAPGSLHPTTGRPYVVDPLAPPIANVREAPAALLALLRRPDRGLQEVEVQIDPEPTEDLAALGATYGLPQRLLDVVRYGRAEGAGKPGWTRSEWVFSACCALVRRGVPDDIIAGLLLDDRWRISESVLESKGRTPEDYAARQIARAHGAIRRRAVLDFHIELDVDDDAFLRALEADDE